MVAGRAAAVAEAATAAADATRKPRLSVEIQPPFPGRNVGKGGCFFPQAGILVCSFAGVFGAVVVRLEADSLRNDQFRPAAGGLRDAEEDCAATQNWRRLPPRSCAESLQSAVQTVLPPSGQDRFRGGLPFPGSVKVA